MPGAPSAPTTSSSGSSVFVLSQSIDTVDFSFSQTVPTVSSADHQGERGTHHEEHPVVAVVTPADNRIDGRSQENEESVDEEGVEVHQYCNGLMSVRVHLLIDVTLCIIINVIYGQECQLNH